MRDEKYCFIKYCGVEKGILINLKPQSQFRKDDHSSPSGLEDITRRRGIPRGGRICINQRKSRSNNDIVESRLICYLRILFQRNCFFP